MRGYILPERVAYQRHGEFHNVWHIYTSGSHEAINNSDCMHTQRARKLKDELDQRYDQKLADLKAWLHAICDLDVKWGYAPYIPQAPHAVPYSKHCGRKTLFFKGSAASARHSATESEDGAAIRCDSAAALDSSSCVRCRAS